MKTLLISFALTLAAIPAVAEVCVQVDGDQDSLAPSELRSSTHLVESLLLEQGNRIRHPDGTCLETYQLHHARFGQSLTITLTGSQGTRRTSVRRIEDLPGAYSQLVRALLLGQDMANSNSTVTRRNVTQSLAYQPRVNADGFWFVRLGFTGVSQSSAGPAFGLGYRYELDTMGIELAFLEFSRGNSSEREQYDDFHMSWIKMMALHYVDPVSQNTPVLGAGLSWSRSQYGGDGGQYEGGGIDVRLRGGFEFLRASTIRMMLQAEAALPLYETKLGTGGRWNPDTNMIEYPGSGAAEWTPSLTISLGIGWGGSDY